MTSETDYRNAQVVGETTVLRVHDDICHSVRCDVPVRTKCGKEEVFSIRVDIDKNLPHFEQIVESHVISSLLKAAKTWKALTHTPCDFVNDDLRDQVVKVFLS
jgi:hypothetical protein